MSDQPAAIISAQINEVTRERDEAVARLSVLVDAFPGECRFDHHGFCQEHLVTKPCEIAEARAFLSRYMCR